MANIRLPDCFSQLHGSRFTAIFGNFALSDAMKRREKVDTTEYGDLDRTNWYWLFGRKRNSTIPHALSSGAKLVDLDGVIASEENW